MMFRVKNKKNMKIRGAIKIEEGVQESSDIRESIYSADVSNLSRSRIFNV